MLQFSGVWDSLPVLKNDMKGGLFAKRTIQIYIKYETLLLLSITLCVVIRRRVVC